jgi:GT2 family glycosyltransferase
MAVVRGHVSGEVGHSRGLSRYVLGAGLVVMAGGMLLFGPTVLRGLADAHGGGSSADHLMPWLPAVASRSSPARWSRRWARRCPATRPANSPERADSARICGVSAPLPVVVVHWNQPERCARTVEAFLGQDVPVDVTIVDGGSEPEALAAVRDLGVEVVALDRNVGFGPGANVGFRRWLEDGKGDWIGLAPHDALPEPDCARRLLDAVAARPRAGLASADFGHDGVPVVDRYFGGILRPGTVDEGWEDAGHPHGTFMVARRACLEDVGLFDERYFAYCEEADLAVRARERGWEVGVVRGAIVRNIHIGSATPAVDYLQLRNTLLLVREHFGWYPATIRFLIALWHLGAGTVSPARRGPYWNAPARVRALRDWLAGRYGPPPPELFTRRR